MKSCLFLFLAGLLASCQNDSSSEPLDIDYTLNQNSTYALRRQPNPATSCLLDTAAILTNAHLDSLLAAASREKFREYRSIKNIPPYVLRFLDCAAGGDFSITDPGMMWNESCSTDDALPDRELTYLGVGKTITLMTYNTGGIARVGHVALIRSNDQEVLDFWCDQWSYAAVTKKQVIAGIYSQEQTAESIKDIAFAKRYILDKTNKTISKTNKESFISLALWL